MGLSTDDRLEAIEKRVAAIEELLNNGFGEKLAELSRLIMGDEQLKVEPLRDTVETLSAGVHRVEKLIDRGKWWLTGLAAGFTVVNVGGEAFVGWVTKLLSG